MITTIQSERIENALISDKDEIIQNINDGLFNLAKSKIEQSANLWACLGYGYKTRELLERLSAEVSQRAQMAIV